jgi:hypothetical protein
MTFLSTDQFSAGGGTSAKGELHGRKVDTKQLFSCPDFMAIACTDYSSYIKFSRDYVP